MDKTRWHWDWIGGNRRGSRKPSNGSLEVLTGKTGCPRDSQPEASHARPQRESQQDFLWRTPYGHKRSPRQMRSFALGEVDVEQLLRRIRMTAIDSHLPFSRLFPLSTFSISANLFSLRSLYRTTLFKSSVGTESKEQSRGSKGEYGR